MTVTTRFGRDFVRGAAIACVLALVIATVIWWLLSAGGSKKITAYFTEAVGLYAGSDVRILGVSVGSIDTVTPGPGQVTVTMSVDRDVAVPAETHAVIIEPSLVSDRYVQLDRYTGGPKISDNGGNTVIPVSRTQPPAELDDLYANLDKLSTSLGPNGANSNGALSDVLNTGAANLSGNGKALHDTLAQLGEATRTLNGNQQDLFATVSNLAKLTTALQDSDAQVRDFSTRLADVSDFLAGERGDLAAAVRELGTALNQVKSFINDNHSALKSNVDNLASVTKVLADNRSSLAELLDIAPLALDNVYNTYNASSATLDARLDLNDLSQPPIVAICKLVQGAANLPDALADACKALSPVLEGVVPLPSVTDVIVALQQGRLPQLPPQVANPIVASMTGPTQGGQ